MPLEDQKYYWVLPKETNEWEVGKAVKIHQMGFSPVAFELHCADSGILTMDHCKEIRIIETPQGAS